MPLPQLLRTRLGGTFTRPCPFRNHRTISAIPSNAPKAAFGLRFAPTTRARFAQVRWNSIKPNFNPTPHLGSPQQLSLSQRLKALSKEYGWTALGVYMGLSVLDFPFCYLAVSWLGAETVGAWEHAIVSRIKSAVNSVFPDLMGNKEEVAKEAPQTEGLRKGEEKASIWTQLALAYAVHKSLIVFRVPLAAAVLPKVVKTMRSWGWQVGKRRPQKT